MRATLATVIRVFEERPKQLINNYKKDVF